MKIYNDCDLLDGDPCPGCKDYMALEAKIRATQKVLDDLINQRPKMRTRINDNHDILTTRVPLEVVLSVFHFCVPSKTSLFHSGYFTREQTKAGMSARLLLGSICNTWRHIAWNAGPLWSMFHLDLDILRKSNQQVVLTREWMERAGKCPLSICISRSFLFFITPEDEEALERLIAIISERSNQWQELDISGPLWLFPKIRSGPRGISSLQSLRVRTSQSAGTTKFSLMDATTAPSHLILDSFPLSSFQINWTHLTRVRVFEPHLHETIELLQRAPNLVYCKIDSIKKANHFSLPNQPILHQNLECLKLVSTIFRQDRIPENVAFLKNFTFPNLRHLKIQNGGKVTNYDNEPPWNSVLSHIISSSPPLISLKIPDLGPGPMGDIILSFLRRTPFLQELEMMAPSDREWDKELKTDFYQLLIDTSIIESNHTQTKFLPNLRYLKLHVAGKDTAILWEALPRIFGPIPDIRNPRRRPLKTLVARVEVDTDLDCLIIEPKDLFLRILRLRQEGIVLDLKCTDKSLDVLEESVKRHDLEPQILEL